MTFEKDIEELNNKGWLDNNFNQKELKDFLEQLNNKDISPQINDIFNAFKIKEDNEICEPKDVKVLILGQDPYPDNNKKRIKKYGYRAHGFAFSFKNPEEPADDSLLNIFKAWKQYISRESEYINELDVSKYKTNLEEWAKNKNVLLLNAALTYEKKEKIKHQSEWKNFRKCIIKKLLTTGNDKLVVLLWGDDAKVLFHNVIYNPKNEKDTIYENIKRNLLVLSTSHPSDNYNANKKGFSYEAPNHFKACDDFLGTNVWKDLWNYIKPYNNL